MKRSALSARSSSMKAALTAAKAAEDDVPISETTTAEQTPGPERGKPVGLSVRLDPVTHERLMDLAHDLSKSNRKRISIHALLLEGIEHVFRHYGR